jgi:hypothetical protein
LRGTTAYRHGSYLRIAGLPKDSGTGTGLPWHQSKWQSGSLSKDEVLIKMRNTIINKILSFQYLLGRRIGRNKARIIAMTLERAFTTLFGREEYEGKKIKQRR